MSRDEIIKLAREAGIEWQHHRGITGAWNTWTCGSQSIEKMERFAALVAAAESEACALVCEGLPTPEVYSDADKSMFDVAAMECASAIRARGQS